MEVIKKAVDYYTCNGSHAFLGFADFSKAFGNVDH